MKLRNAVAPKTLRSDLGQVTLNGKSQKLLLKINMF